MLDDYGFALLNRFHMLNKFFALPFFQVDELVFIVLPKLPFGLLALFLPLGFDKQHISLHFFSQDLILLNISLAFDF